MNDNRNGKNPIDLRRWEIALIVLSILFMSVYALKIGHQRYSSEEATEAGGHYTDISKGWMYENPEKGDEDFNIPGFFDTAEGSYTIYRDLSDNFSGQAIAIDTSNAALDVYIDGECVYESSRIDYEAGLVLADLPMDIADGSRVDVVLHRVEKNTPVIVRFARVSRRDDAIKKAVSQSMLPLLCAVFILICAVILETLDIIRVVQKKRRRGLVILSFFALDAIFYSFIRTEIFNVFFGNRLFFQTIEEVSYIFMPLFVTGFFLRGFKRHFPRGMRALFYISLLVAIIDLVTYPFWGDYHVAIYFINVIWKLVIIVILMCVLAVWNAKMSKERKIFMDEAALICLGVSIISSPVPYKIMGMEYLDTLKTFATTSYFIFMTAQHVQIILGESRFQAEKRQKELEEQNEELRIAQNIAEEAKTEAELANEAKSRFLANMSHEIRTPINAVLGMDEMILRESKNPSVREYALDIRSAGRTLLSLINDILDFSKIESGKMEIVPVEYDVATMVMDLYNMIRPRIEAKDLDFIMEVDENIPKSLFGDDVRVRQCITNILTNAVKYTPEGKVWLRMRGEKAEDGYMLHCEVEDTGIGIKEEDIPKLFKEYERIEESRNRNIEGTGLGMNITMAMLSLMGSRLEVKSVYGKGSVFWFDVKQGIVDEEPVGNIEEAHKSEADAVFYTDAFIAPDAHVLVVDDNAMNRKVFMNLLKATEIQIDEADCGPAAIELVKNNPYHFIFMDHMMPDMDGIETMKAIKELGDETPNAHTPIYVLTANAVAGAREMYMAEGFDGFLSKPVASDKLEEALRDNLPQELMKPAPEGQGITGSGENNGPPEDLPQVDGLDWSFAWIHLPGMDILEESVRQFYELIDVHGDKLRGYYEALPGEMDNYRIQVHGMKSSAATIGIIPLAGLAKILEFAAKDGNMDIIGSTHDIFMNEWYSYKDKLKGVFGIVPAEEGGADLPPAEFGKTMAYLELLRNAMEDYDIDTGDDIVSKLKENRYPEEIAPILQKIYGAVADLDSDLINELVDSVYEKGEWKS